MDRKRTVTVTYLALLVWLLLPSFTVKCHSSVDVAKLILVSLDGFRWDYLKTIPDKDLPNFTFLRQNGAWAENGMKNAFITKTLPNHMTLVTGLYEESHGLVANEFYDPKFKETFSLLNATQLLHSKWYNSMAEPIWVVNQEGNGERHSGSVMWPGCGAVQKGRLPSKYLLFIKEIDFKTRIDVLISWFVDKEPINLGLLYIDEPDHTGHVYGPNSTQLINKVKELDGVLGYLIKKLKAEKLWEDMNLIITSDHGMTATPEDNYINLDDYVKPDLYKVYSLNPVGLVIPNEGKEEEVYNGFETVPHLTVYKKEKIPDHFHYKNNRRILPIFLLADQHYGLRSNNSAVHIVRGNHGYSNEVPDMRPIFMAHGPAFKTIQTEKIFSNTDIYPMMCHILGVNPGPNNGSLDRVELILKPRHPVGGITVAYFVLIPIVLCVAAVLAVAACHQRHFSRRRVVKGPGVYPGYPSTTLQTSLISDTEDDEDDLP